MTYPTRLIAILALAALAGCGSTVQSSRFGSGPVVTSAPAFETTQPLPTINPAQQTAEARAMTSISGFLDPQAESQLSANSQNQAAGAQFNALQFGRPGAPRNWQGDKGVSGQVTVGPYVRVNSIDCRDFTHTVTIEGANFSRKGTACREVDGRWSVVGAATG